LLHLNLFLLSDLVWHWQPQRELLPESNTDMRRNCGPVLEQQRSRPTLLVSGLSFQA
jgi:hypothetical protein